MKIESRTALEKTEINGLADLPDVLGDWLLSDRDTDSVSYKHKLRHNLYDTMSLFSGKNETLLITHHLGAGAKQTKKLPISKYYLESLIDEIDDQYSVEARTALEAPKSWKRFYFVFELKPKFKDCHAWFKFFKKNIEQVRLSSAGMLTDRVAVLVGDVPIFVDNLEPDQYGNQTQYTDEERKRIRKSIESIRDYIVRQDVVERGLAIDESSYGFGSLIRDYIRDKIDPDRRNVFNRIENYYQWELPLWLRR